MRAKNRRQQARRRDTFIVALACVPAALIAGVMIISLAAF
jgi:hypothetical protein